MSKTIYNNSDSFYLFRKSLKRIHCSTPTNMTNIEESTVDIKNGIKNITDHNFLTEHVWCNLFTDNKDDTSELEESEGFNSFSSKSYKGDISDLRSEIEDSTSEIKESQESIYFSALSHISDDENTSVTDDDNTDCFYSTDKPLGISTIIYKFNKLAPVITSSFNNVYQMGVTSTQLETYMKETKCYLQAKVLKILPETQDELSIICMQCEDCLEFFRLKTPDEGITAYFSCPNKKCEGTLFNPVFNIKLTLHAAYYQKTALLNDQNAILFFGVHPLIYITNTELRQRVFSALKTLLSHKEYWFCVEHDFDEHVDNIIETSLLYVDENQSEKSHYGTKLYKYRIC